MINKRYSRVLAHVRDETRAHVSIFLATAAAIPVGSVLAYLFVTRHGLGDPISGAAYVVFGCALVCATLCAFASLRLLGPYRSPEADIVSSFGSASATMLCALALALGLGAIAYASIGSFATTSEHDRVALAGAVAQTSSVWFGLVLIAGNTWLTLADAFDDSARKGYAVLGFTAAVLSIIAMSWIAFGV